MGSKFIVSQYYPAQLSSKSNHLTLHSIECTSSYGVSCKKGRIQVLGGEITNHTFDSFHVSWIFPQNPIDGKYHDWFRFTGDIAETVIEYIKRLYTFHILQMVIGTGTTIFLTLYGTVPRARIGYSKQVTAPPFNFSRTRISLITDRISLCCVAMAQLGPGNVTLYFICIKNGACFDAAVNPIDTLHLENGR